MGLFGLNFGSRKQGLEVVRDKLGNWSYWLEDTAFGNKNSNYLEWSLCNPVLFAVIHTRAKLYSKMHITAVDSEGKEVNTPYLDLLYSPNYFQSKEDFFYQQSHYLSATGNNLIYQKNILKIKNEVPKGLFNLHPSCIDYNKTLNVKSFFTKDSDIREFENKQIIYSFGDEKLKISLRDIIPLYDVSTGLEKNSIFKSVSRVKSVEKNLINIEENLKASNINLRMSQKYLARNKNNYQGTATQMHEEDKEAVKHLLLSEKLHVTNGDIEVQHLVTDLKKLYLNEQMAHEANVVSNAFEMNKHVINYGLTDSTFDNQELGIIRYIQNSIQADADNTMNSLTNSWGLSEKGIKLKASYNHLPIMQPLVKEKISTFTELQNSIKIAIENKTISNTEAVEMTNKLLKDLGL